MFSSFVRRCAIMSGGAAALSSYMNHRTVYARVLDDMDEKFDIFTGTSNPTLAQQVAMILGKPLSTAHLQKFADGEISVKIDGSVRGKDIYIIQSTCPPIHDNLMELILFISAARRASARSIVAVIPYFGYQRQDRIRRLRETIAADDVATLLECVGADAVVSVDLHRRQIEGFFDATQTSMDYLETLRAALPILLEKDLYNPVIVCPSDTGVFRAKKLKYLLEQEGVLAKVAFVTTYNKIEKSVEFVDEEMEQEADLHHHRLSDTRNTEIIGTVHSRDVIILDDMIDSGNRMCNAAQKCHDCGARRIFAFATHGIFSGEAIDHIESSPVDEVLVTNTIYPPTCISMGSVNPDGTVGKWTDKISYVSIAPIVAETIRRIQVRNSLTTMTHLKGY